MSWLICSSMCYFVTVFVYNKKCKMSKIEICCNWIEICFAWENLKIYSYIFRFIVMLILVIGELILQNGLCMQSIHGYMDYTP